MKVYLDDVRKPYNEEWVLVATPKEVIELLKTNTVTDLSLDHDLGDDVTIGTGYDVILWIEEQVFTTDFKPPRIRVHSDNSSARVKMQAGIKQINERYYNKEKGN